MKHFNRFFAAFLVALLLALLSACAPNLALVEVTPLPEEATALVATPTATPVPTETPIPTLSPEETKTAELNQQFQDFLNKEGDFTQEKIASMMMEFYSGTTFVTALEFDKEKVRLGVTDQGWRVIQGYFFDYFEKDNKILLIMGFDGKDDSRFITLVETGLYSVDEIDLSILGYVLFKVNNINGIDYNKGDEVQSNGDIVFNPSDNMKYMECSGRQEIISLLDNLKGKAIVLELDDYLYSEADILNYSNAEFIEKGRLSIEQEYNVEIDSEAWKAFIAEGVEYLKNERPLKVELAYGLADLVATNGMDYQEYLDKKIVGNSNDILKFDNANNFGDIDITKAPILSKMIFYEGILDGE